MIVSCEECGLKYKIDPSKIKGEQARLKCKGCSTIITLHKSELLEAENEKPLEKSSEVNDSTVNKATDSGLAAEQFQKHSGIGLTSKVILLMLLVSLLPGALYFGLSFKQTSDHIIKETTETGLTISSILSEEVDEWIDKNGRVLQTLSELPAIQSMNRYEQEKMLKAVQKHYPWMYLVFTTDSNGLNVARSDGKGLKDYSNRQYVKDVIQEGKTLAWQTLIGETSKKAALVLSVPIMNDGDVVGVLASAMTRDAISLLVTNYQLGMTGNVFLVDEIGKVVAHQNVSYVTDQKDMSSHPLVVAGKNQSKAMVEFKGDGNKDLIGFSNKTKLGWTLALQQEKGEVFSTLKKSQTYAYALLGGTVICILIIAFFASRAIVNPIRKLTDAANRISVGELGVEIENTSSDEIGDLADAITRMQESIRLSIRRLKQRRR